LSTTGLADIYLFFLIYFSVLRPAASGWFRIVEITVREVLLRNPERENSTSIHNDVYYRARIRTARDAVTVGGVARYLNGAGVERGSLRYVPGPGIPDPRALTTAPAREYVRVYLSARTAVHTHMYV
jgi:hypothetical protein